MDDFAAVNEVYGGGVRRPPTGAFDTVAVAGVAEGRARRDRRDRRAVRVTPPEEIVAAIREASAILIATHSPMDGDGMGCGLALMRCLRKMGRR